MPSYRTTSLFHYTKEVDNLFNILKSGKLIPNYCKEDLSTKEFPHFIWGIPMVCFCDIPILLADKFLSNYGHYSIAFSKEWGTLNGCNPILYVNNSRIILSLYHFINRIKQLQDFEKKDGAIKIEQTRETLSKEKSEEYSKLVIPVYKEVNNELLLLKISIDNLSKLYYLGFLKKYESEWRNNSYNNYDENEWRYIVEETDSIKWLNERELVEWRGDVTNPKPQPSTALIRASLKFSPSDIHHIILYEESEIPAFIRRIRELEKIGNIVLDADTKDILISKISSFERIQKDY